MTALRTLIALVLLPAALAACGGGGEPPAKNIDELDAQLTQGVSANGTDPLLAASLQDQIMVDPTLASKSNADSIRPPSQPYAAPIPSPDVANAPADDAELKSAPDAKPGQPCRECAAARNAVTLGALAGAQADARTRNCANDVGYAAGWANRLQRDLPLHPAARVIEAAGNATRGCALRIVSFTAALPMKRVLDWYYTRATAAGYSAGHQADGEQHVLAGTRKDGAAYVLFLTERDGGTNADLVVNNGV